MGGFLSEFHLAEHYAVRFIASLSMSVWAVAMLASMHLMASGHGLNALGLNALGLNALGLNALGLHLMIMTVYVYRMT